MKSTCLYKFSRSDPLREHKLRRKPVPLLVNRHAAKIGEENPLMDMNAHQHKIEDEHGLKNMIP